MTDRTEGLKEAIADHDITRAITPAQLVALVIGVFVVLSVLRGLWS